LLTQRVKAGCLRASRFSTGAMAATLAHSPRPLPSFAWMRRRRAHRYRQPETRDARSQHEIQLIMMCSICSREFAAIVAPQGDPLRCPTCARFFRLILDALDLADLKALSILPLAGESAVIAAPNRAGTLAPLPLWEAFAAKVLALAPALIVLDTSADFFGGNEISRSEVRQFVSMLRGLALKVGCAIVLVSHPSVAGMNTGTGLSRSTAWNNSVRSRLYLTRPIAGEDEPVDPDLRTLQTMKSNYGCAGGEIRLRWLDGRFVNDTPATPGGLSKIAIEAKAERVFLDLLQ
jgi:DNA-directed RNA polymerase subunit RPC12/RpoP